MADGVESCAPLTCIARKVIARCMNVANIESFTRGPYSLQNPQTGRVVNLRTPSQKRRFLETAKARIEKSEAYNRGIDGYQFRRLPERSNTVLSTFELKLKYHVPISRASLDVGRFVSNFLEANG